VFDGGITFYKDGTPTADRLTVSGTQQAAGTFQLGAGFGSATGFVGQQIQQKIAATQDNFKDPESALSAGLSDLLAVFQVLADDMVEFAEAVAKDFLQLLDTLLGQIVGWLDEPIDIPFVSALYHALTGQPPLSPGAPAPRPGRSGGPRSALPGRPRPACRC